MLLLKVSMRFQAVIYSAAQLERETVLQHFQNIHSYIQNMIEFINLFNKKLNLLWIKSSPCWKTNVFKKEEHQQRRKVIPKNKCIIIILFIFFFKQKKFENGKENRVGPANQKPSVKIVFIFFMNSLPALFQLHNNAFLFIYFFLSSNFVELLKL